MAKLSLPLFCYYEGSTMTRMYPEGWEVQTYVVTWEFPIEHLQLKVDGSDWIKLPPGTVAKFEDMKLVPPGYEVDRWADLIRRLDNYRVYTPNGGTAMYDGKKITLSVIEGVDEPWIEPNNIDLKMWLKPESLSINIVSKEKIFGLNRVIFKGEDRLDLFERLYRDDLIQANDLYLRGRHTPKWTAYRAYTGIANALGVTDEYAYISSRKMFEGDEGKTTGRKLVLEEEKPLLPEDWFFYLHGPPDERWLVLGVKSDLSGFIPITDGLEAYPSSFRPSDTDYVIEHCAKNKVFIHFDGEDWRMVFAIRGRTFRPDTSSSSVLFHMAHVFPVKLHISELSEMTRAFRGLPLSAQQAIWAVPTMSAALNNALNTVRGRVLACPHDLMRWSTEYKPLKGHYPMFWTRIGTYGADGCFRAPVHNYFLNQAINMLGANLTTMNKLRGSRKTMQHVAQAQPSEGSKRRLEL